MLTDTHCHLDPETYGDDAGVDEVIARARAAGVTRMVTIGSGYGPVSGDRARRVAQRHGDVWFTIGLHPHDAKDWGGEVRERMTALAADPKCVAFGEMGLDFHYDNSPRDQQRTCLREQIQLSLSLGMPVCIHDRDSDNETLRILVDEGAFDGKGVLFHCYSGDVVTMNEIVALGGFVSIPGIVTFKTAGIMQEVAREVPIDRLVIETDSPFLTPVPFRGKKNEPARVALVAEKVAALRGMPVAELADVTTRNAIRFYGLPTA